MLLVLMECKERVPVWVGLRSNDPLPAVWDDHKLKCTGLVVIVVF